MCNLSVNDCLITIDKNGKLKTPPVIMLNCCTWQSCPLPSNNRNLCQSLRSYSVTLTLIETLLKLHPSRLFILFLRSIIPAQYFFSTIITCTNTLRPMKNGHHFCRQHFQMYFLEWQPSYFDFHFTEVCHDDVIKWKHFPRYWPFVRWTHWSPVNSPHKSQWRGAFFDLLE